MYTAIRGCDTSARAYRYFTFTSKSIERVTRNTNSFFTYLLCFFFLLFRFDGHGFRCEGTHRDALYIIVYGPEAIFFVVKLCIHVFYGVYSWEILNKNCNTGFSFYFLCVTCCMRIHLPKGKDCIFFFFC